MPKLVPIVEGDGDVAALPNLLTRILHSQGRYDLHIETPRTAQGKSNIDKPNGLEQLIYLARTVPGCAAILVLVDADERCPGVLAPSLAARAEALKLPVPLAVVCAKCEYETWLVASIETLRGQNIGRYTLAEQPQVERGKVRDFPADVETISNCKAWLGQYIPANQKYSEQEDQLPMTRLLDIALVRGRSRSFRRLYHALEELTSAVDAQQTGVTPTPQVATT